MAVKPLLVSLRAMDAVGLLALLLVSLTNLLFSAQVPQWGLLVLLNLVIAVLLLLLISSAAKSDAPLLTFLRD